MWESAANERGLVSPAVADTKRQEPALRETGPALDSKIPHHRYINPGNLGHAYTPEQREMRRFRSREKSLQ
jgi:hypothetical protein